MRAVKLVKDTGGATPIEYGLIAACRAVAAISATSRLGGRVSSTFNSFSATSRRNKMWPPAI